MKRLVWFIAAVIFLGASPATAEMHESASRLLNRERIERDLARLELSVRMSKHATRHSQQMAFDAESSIFARPYPLTKQESAAALTGRRIGVESVGAGDTLAEVVKRFLHREDREHLLSTGFTHFGVGVARSTDGRYWMTVIYFDRNAL